MSEALIRIIPIFSLILLGKFISYKNWMTDETSHTIKLGIINIALPLVLFQTFKNMTLKPESFLVSLVTFFLLVLFYLIGVLLSQLINISPILPFFVTAYAFGLLGIPLFEAVYGSANLGDLSILGIGNEFFIWFVYFTLVKQKLNNQAFDKHTIIEFMRSPMILAILIGLLSNIVHLDDLLDQNILYKGFLGTTSQLASLTSPLILLVIGAGLRFDFHYIKRSGQLVLIRLLVTLLVGYLIKFLIIDPLYGATSIFNKAFFTYLILPPPFALAIFVSKFSGDEEAVITNNAIVLSTLVSIIGFTAMVFITSM